VLSVISTGDTCFVAIRRRISMAVMNEKSSAVPCRNPRAGAVSARVCLLAERLVVILAFR
jgi:hypothetical protein